MKQQTQENKIEWQEVELGKVCSLLSGFAFSSSLFNSDKIGLPLIRIRNISKGYTETYYSGDYVKDYLVNKEDLLIGMDGEFNLFEWKGETGLLNQRVCKLIPNTKKVNPKYIYYALPLKLKEIENRTPFVTVKHLSSKDILSIILNLPDLEEQERIVKILEKAERLKEQSKKANELLDEYLKSVFYEMFLKENGRYPRIKLGNVALAKKGAMRMGPFGSQLKKNELVRNGVRVLWIENIVNNKFEYGDEKFITLEKFDELSGFETYPNNILITMMGTIGKVAIVPKNLGKSIISSHLLKIEVDNSRFNSIFLQHLLLTPFVQEQWKKQSHGIVMSGLNTGIIKNAEIFEPAITLQHKFASIVEHVEKMKEKVKMVQANSDELFNSLMQKAFREGL